ncbi:peptide deformylase [Carboxydochorda subterranea]|uniref:Peptide deformylase n=1 Tax=Carboxydichorda subterranea TaxID=3109565 RepID=A0ABZ1C068_9FIRM|nr:peptide deformylase [Limnochorda sp. L945t]WRP18398.1 peptide deformylase [Limnochorda sp. L945t]
MAVLPILRIGAPVLRQKAKPVQRVTRRHRKLIEDMRETMEKAPGVGLAANQVGVLERIVVVDPGDRFMALINPEILTSEGSDVDVEGCLSIPGVTGYVERAARIRIRALDERGRPLELDAEGYLARIIQHEVDHLDGVLFIDRASRIVQEEEGEASGREEGAPPRQLGQAAVVGSPGPDRPERGNRA